MAKAKGEGPRIRAARDDADVGTIEKNVEKVYGLPPGSVEIKDRGRNIRDDAKIRTVRKRAK